MFDRLTWQTNNPTTRKLTTNLNVSSVYSCLWFHVCSVTLSFTHFPAMSSLRLLSLCSVEFNPLEGVLQVSTVTSTEHRAGKAAAEENPENLAPGGDSDVLHSFLGVTPLKRCCYLFILSGAASQTKSWLQSVTSLRWSRNCFLSKDFSKFAKYHKGLKKCLK